MSHPELQPMGPKTESMIYVMCAIECAEHKQYPIDVSDHKFYSSLAGSQKNVCEHLTNIHDLTLSNSNA